MGTVHLVDINGDGLSDFVYSIYSVGTQDGVTSEGSMISGVLRNTGQGWTEDLVYRGSFPAALSVIASETDYSGISSCAGTQRAAVVHNCFVPAYEILIYSFPTGTRLVDLNGDGLLDLVSNTEGPYRTADTPVPLPTIGAWINTGAGWDRFDAFTPPYPVVSDNEKYPEDTGIRFVDLNGDGLTDAIKTAGPEGTDSPTTFGASGVWLNDGSGWCDLASCPEAQKYLAPEGFTKAKGNKVVSSQLRLADLNADGLVDLIRGDGSNDRKA